jgi:hypothetical protein
VLTSLVFHREFLTHPEFANVYIPHPTNNPTPPANFLAPTVTNLVGRVNTYFPRLITIPAPSASPDERHWVLATPCAAVQLPPDLPTLTDSNHTQYNPTWAPPAVFVTHYEHSMVLVFDVQDHDSITDPTAAIPTYTLVGPRPLGAAFNLDAHDWEGRSYLFTADYGGSVQVWDVTELLEEPQGRVVAPSDGDYYDFLHEDWLAPLSVSDDIENNVWSIAVDPVAFSDALGERNELYVYVLVGRYGIEVLRWLPSEPAGQRLVPVRRIEVPNGQGGMVIRRTSNPLVRTLLVSEGLIGLRSFEYEE